MITKGDTTKVKNKIMTGLGLFFWFYIPVKYDLQYIYQLKFVYDTEIFLAILTMEKNLKSLLEIVCF